ncbi:MAG TPA: GAF domain-containing protein [Candidatus Accumulibacter phosphatis]|nr:MAG: Nif-specific regulatory protein [Candidatus Accumulibacter sp. SK-11]HAY29646.1 GAF domain-containing protein [Accumulibacter sp.]HRL75428.1 GAF domain-containing protein [Candidatus Accumulibacter phosphatis]HCN67920.1 GAF domain-containing protein [Accumulibacter sp.]HCV12575.1 GAF domain-containing protein [Accumulibacter sp.]
MATTENPLLRLKQFAGLLEEGSHDESLQRLAEATARILESERCSLMLRSEDENSEVRWRVCASFGPLPERAFLEEVRTGEGIAGCVAASGEALLIADIERSEFASCARRTEDPCKSLLSVPVRNAGAIVGVLNVSAHRAGRAFGIADLHMLEVVSLLVAQAIQIRQLRGLLNSRFAQLALLDLAEKDLGRALANPLPNPDQVARIIARSFYKEMNRVGLGPRQIVNAASEIIEQLSGSIVRHSRRLEREAPDAADARPLA